MSRFRCGPGAASMRPLLLVLLALAGCSEQADSPVEPVEVVRRAPLTLALEADGELHAIKSQPLLVPGAQWQRRQLTWLAADGSAVHAGDVVARFSSASAEMELQLAVLDLERNALAHAGKRDELAGTEGRVGVDLAKVGTDLAIAERYADADFTMLARNEILDAIQDRGFLNTKQGVLEWRHAQASDRGAAELAVLDAQKATFSMTAERERQDLSALELVAPNDGVLVLSSDWSGDKPKVGEQMWSGNELATLPDASTLEVQLSLPQLVAAGVAVGQAVTLHPVGRPEQAVDSTLSWVAAAAQQKNRDDPVRYLSMKASVPAEAATRYGWVPGQAFHARIVLAEREAALSVPTLALRSEQGRHEVLVRDGDDWHAQTIELGVRGPARAEVLSGLEPGQQVRLLPTAADARSAP